MTLNNYLIRYMWVGYKDFLMKTVAISQKNVSIFFFKRVKRSHLKNTVSLKCCITKCANALNGTGAECKHIQSKCHERRKIRRCLADMLYIFRFSSLHALCFILSVYICHCQVEEMRSYTFVAISVPWAGNRKCCFSKQHHSGIVLF